MPCLQLGVQYVDLYLIHSPRRAVPDIPTAWAEMENIKRAGLARCSFSAFPGFLCCAGIYQTFRSIGVSNFDEKDLEILLASAKIKPDANQVRITRYNLNANYSNLIGARSSYTHMCTAVNNPSWNTLRSTAL